MTIPKVNIYKQTYQITSHIYTLSLSPPLTHTHTLLSLTGYKHYQKKNLKLHFKLNT